MEMLLFKIWSQVCVTGNARVGVCVCDIFAIHYFIKTICECVFMFNGRKRRTETNLFFLRCFPHFTLLSDETLNWAAMSYWSKTKCVICLLSHHQQTILEDEVDDPVYQVGPEAHEQERNIASLVLFSLFKLGIQRKSYFSLILISPPVTDLLELMIHYSSPFQKYTVDHPSGQFCSTIQLPFASAVL